jgi:hypothetical protein
MPTTSRFQDVGLSAVSDTRSEAATCVKEICDGDLAKVPAKREGGPVFAVLVWSTRDRSQTVVTGLAFAALVAVLYACGRKSTDIGKQSRQQEQPVIAFMKARTRFFPVVFD